MTNRDVYKIVALLLLILATAWSIALPAEQLPLWGRLAYGVASCSTTYFATTAILGMCRSMYRRGVRDGGGDEAAELRRGRL